MTEQFLQKIFSDIKEQDLIEKGDIILAGVSGGADSMCMLEVLRAYRREVDFELRVIHVEHGIRGEASLSDADYVQGFCEEHAIMCKLVHVDARAYSQTHAVSVEEAARELRYEAFERAAREAERDRKNAGKPADCGATPVEAKVRIAVAHHMEDQAETMLWQMIRGSDIKGMGGMRPKRERIIRPLLFVERAQIESFLRETGICWREDATNKDNVYTRNRLRMDVLPVLAQLNSRVIEHLCESADRLQETEDYLAAQTDLLYDRYVEKTSRGGLLVRAALMKEHSLMQRRVLYRVLETVSGRAKDLGTKHVTLLRELFSRQAGRELTLMYGVVAVRIYEGVELLPESAQEAQLHEEHMIPDQIRMEVLDCSMLTEISKKKYTKWFDYDKIECNVQIRRRRSGDYLVIDKDGHRQKLKNYLVNEKIPKAERDGLWLLADGSHIMWVIGHRISDYYKVDEHPPPPPKVQLSGGKEDE